MSRLSAAGITLTGEKRPIPGTLRWLLFVIGIGTLVSAGIYLHVAIAAEFDIRGLLRAVMFLLPGNFFVLMYGENNRS